MEEHLITLGFESFLDFTHLVALVDISTDEKLKAFDNWRDLDGTKQGLLDLGQIKK